MKTWLLFASLLVLPAYAEDNGHEAPGAATRAAPHPSHANPNFNYTRDCRAGGDGPYRFTWRTTVQDTLLEWVNAELSDFHPHDGELPLVSDLNRLLNNPERFLRWYHNGKQQRLERLQTRQNALQAAMRNATENARRRGLLLGKELERLDAELESNFHDTVGGRTGEQVRAYWNAQNHENVLSRRFGGIAADYDNGRITEEEFRAAEIALEQAEAATAAAWEQVRNVYNLGFLTGDLDAAQLARMVTEFRQRSPEIATWLERHRARALLLAQSLAAQEEIFRLGNQLTDAMREAEELRFGTDERANLVAHLLRTRASVPFVLSVKVQERQRIALPFGVQGATLALCSAQLFHGNKSASQLVHIDETAPVCEDDDRGQLRRAVRDLFHAPPSSDFENEVACSQSPSFVRPVDPLLRQEL